MTRNLILGTAGHIDHGKTSLVKALTGIDCDRLPEEKARGITIDIGFAHLELGDFALGIVDVPGHERFIKNMLAGATGFDLCLLVIAADDSVMPQTREHLEILCLLGLSTGVIALTKSDLVDATTRGVAELEIRELVQGTFLAEAPIVHTSASTRLGLDEQRTALTEACQRVTEREEQDWFRMPIDRVFVVQGHGTVVTGSVLNGRLRVGDEVDWLPVGQRVRVRSLQSHGATVDEVRRGMRAAINLAGVPHENVVRGQELASPDILVPARLMTLQLRCLADARQPIKHRASVRFHIGTAEILGQLVLLDSTRLEPGQWGLAQVHLEEPALAVYGQPFVVRSPGAERTLGGGTILQPSAVPMRRRHVELIERVEKLVNAADQERVRQLAWFAGPKGLTARDLIRGARLSPMRAEALIAELTGAKELAALNLGPGRAPLLAAERVRALEERVLAGLKKLHELEPAVTFHERHKVMAQLAFLEDVPLTNAIIERLLQDGRLKGDERRLALAEHAPRLSPALKALRDKLLAACLEGRFNLPDLNSVDKSGRLKEVLQACVAEGVLIHVEGDFYLHADLEPELKRLVTEKLQAAGKVTMSEMREVLNTTRRSALPLAAYLDRIGLTRRDGDYRVLA